MTESIDPITTHAEDAVGRLITFYRRKETMTGAVSATAQRIQALENVFLAIKACRAVADAEGVQLDRIGEVVGVRRPTGYSDAKYRIVVLAKIGQNNSNGETEAIISIAKLITGSTIVRIEEHFPAKLSLQVNGDIDESLADLARDLLRRSLLGGVGLDYIVKEPGSNPFRFAGGAGSGGFGDVNDPSVGGKLASLL